MKPIVTKRKNLIILVTVIAIIGAIVFALIMSKNFFLGLSKTQLPSPLYHSNISIEQALQKRRSVRQYKDEPVSLQEVGQLLWAAQGITSKEGFRTAPSAGALYPLEIYVVAGDVRNLPAGVYHYLPAYHALALIARGDKRNELVIAALNQTEVQHASADIIITGVYKRTAVKYGKLAERFVDMEAGHAAENIYLQAVSLKIGTVSLGGLDPLAVKKAIHLSNDEDPLYIMPIGKV